MTEVLPGRGWTSSLLTSSTSSSGLGPSSCAWGTWTAYSVSGWGGSTATCSSVTSTATRSSGASTAPCSCPARRRRLAQEEEQDPTPPEQTLRSGGSRSRGCAELGEGRLAPGRRPGTALIGPRLILQIRIIRQ